MDKIVHYSIKDMLTVESDISVSIRITTKNFPVDEILEYHNAGKWTKDISTISRVYNDDDTQKEWMNYQSRLLSFLDEGNMRVIMDIMDKNDEYFSDKYKLKVLVENVDIID
ncbi:MAG: hypothetical protein E7Z84_02850 [Methanosphaera stadtmanae]|nr:hypothetical protein [Methanosphaera stadtmanae]